MRVLMQIKDYARLLRSNQLLRHNAVLFAGSMVAAALNYLFYPAVGRMVQPGEFGEIQVAVTLSVQAAAVFSIVRLVVVREVANSEDSRASEFTNRVQHLVWQAALAIAFAGIVLSPFIARLLQYRSAAPIVLTVGMVVLGIARAPVGGFIRGKQLFSQAAIADVAFTALKLVLAAGLAAVGASVNGVLAGVIAALAASYAMELWWARRAGLRMRDSRRRERLSVPVVMFALRSLASIGAASMAMVVLVGLDTVVAKRYFTPEIAGLYSGISVVSNILFYGTFSVTSVLFSAVKRRQPAAANRRILVHSALLLGLIGLAGMAIFILWHDEVTGLLLGSRFVPLAHLLPYAGGAMLALSCTNLIMMYCIALNAKGVGAVSLLGIGLVLGSTLLYHDTIDQLAISYCVGNVLMLATSMAWFIIKNPHRASSEQ